MPNWCNNKLTITPKTKPARILLETAVLNTQAPPDSDKPGFLATMVPMPEEISKTVAGWPRDEAKDAEMVAKYGYADWYDWCVANWGTKWDFHSPHAVAEGDGFVIDFDTAWSPPIDALDKLTDLYDMSLSYVEYGMDFAGTWVNGVVVEDGGLSGLSWQEVAEQFPQTDAALGIAESLAEFESMNKEDE